MLAGYCNNDTTTFDPPKSHIGKSWLGGKWSNNEGVYTRAPTSLPCASSTLLVPACPSAVPDVLRRMTNLFLLQHTVVLHYKHQRSKRVPFVVRRRINPAPFRLSQTPIVIFVSCRISCLMTSCPAPEPARQQSTPRQKHPGRPRYRADFASWWQPRANSAIDCRCASESQA